jgi:hypothetical protein
MRHGRSSIVLGRMRIFASFCKKKRFLSLSGAGPPRQPRAQGFFFEKKNQKTFIHDLSDEAR